MDITTLNKQVQNESLFLQDLKREVSKVIVGQENLIEKMLVALLADGHILIEGVPGLAKTLAVKTLSSAIHAQFQRIQFTPDLLPADITGTLIFNPKEGVFYPKRGPIFSTMKLTVLRPRCKAPCWKPCKSAKLLSAKKPILCRLLLWCWPPKTP